MTLINGSKEQTSACVCVRACVRLRACFCLCALWSFTYFLHRRPTSADIFAE